MRLMALSAVTAKTRLAMADTTLLSEIRALALNGVSHGLLADDYCSQIVAKIDAANVVVSAAQGVMSSAQEFEACLRTVCFQPPTPEARDLAKCAWEHALSLPAHDTAAIRNAALEEFDDLVAWLLGENGEFPDRPERIAGKPYPYYWWRTELRKRYEALQSSPQGAEKGGAA
jgi:hypothetical protein